MCFALNHMIQIIKSPTLAVLTIGKRFIFHFPRSDQHRRTQEPPNWRLPAGSPLEMEGLEAEQL
jgi:hypothetical protein